MKRSNPVPPLGFSDSESTKESSTFDTVSKSMSDGDDKVRETLDEEYLDGASETETGIETDQEEPSGAYTWIPLHAAAGARSCANGKNMASGLGNLEQQKEKSESDEEEPTFLAIYPTPEEEEEAKMLMQLAVGLLINELGVCFAQIMVKAFKLNPLIIKDLFDLEHLAPIFQDKLKLITPRKIISGFSTLLAIKQGTFDELIINHIIAKLRIGFPLYAQGLQYIPSVVDVYATGFVEDMWIQDSRTCLPKYCIPNKLTVEGYNKVAYRRKVSEWKKYDAEQQQARAIKDDLRYQIGKRYENQLDLPLSGRELIRYRMKRALKRGKQYHVAYPIIPKYRTVVWGSVKKTWTHQEDQIPQYKTECTLGRNAQLFHSFMNLYTELHPKAQPEIPTSILGTVHKLNLEQEVESMLSKTPGETGGYIDTLRLLSSKKPDTMEQFKSELPKSTGAATKLD